MDPSTFSSNWKKLQKTLATAPQAPSSRKRKHPASSAPPPPASRPSTRKKLKPTTWPPPRPRETTTTTETPDPARGAMDSPPDAPPAAARLGKYIALDTEMVGVAAPTAFSLPNKRAPHDHSIAARVSLVALDGAVVYDSYVLPPAGVPVTDFRTPFSGIAPRHLRPGGPARTLAQVQRDVAPLLDGRVLVAHAAAGDLRVLGLAHPRARVRDTAVHAPFREMYAAAEGGDAVVRGEGRREGGVGRKGAAAAAAGPRRLRAPPLRWLASRLLGWEIQTDERAGHSSAEDARATMALFAANRAAFEAEARRLFGRGAAAPADVSAVQVGVDAAGVDEAVDGENGAQDGADRHASSAEQDGGSADSDSDGDGRPKPAAKKRRRRGKKKGKYRRG